MLSVNGRSSSLVACRSVTCRSCKGRLAKGRSPEGEGTIVQRCLTEEHTRKGKYKSSLRKADTRAVCTRAVWGTADGEEYSKQLILGSGFKTADLIWESKRRFGLVVRPITNKYYINSFHYLSFLPPALGLLSFAVQTFDLSLTLDQSPGSIGKPNRWII